MNFDLPDHRFAERSEDGFILVQPDPMGSKGTLPSYEALLPFGLIVRPKDPSDNFGCNLLVMRQGQEGRVFIGHDPRWMSALPDFGDGGAALYATTELAGAKVTPFIGFFGQNGEAGEGTFRCSVPTSNGTAQIEVSTNGNITLATGGSTIVQDGATGQITVTAATGMKIVLNGMVEAGAAGGLPIVIDNGTFAAWLAALTTAGAAIGLTVPAFVMPIATKAKAT